MPPDEQTILTIWLCVWLALLGAALGSFLDCAVSRWAAGDPHPFGGRSRCDGCGHTLGGTDLIPVFSFLLRRGKCRYCGEKIPARCLGAELAGAVVLVCVGARFGVSLELAQWLIWGALLLALSLTDLFRRIIPDRLLLALAVNRAVWFFVLREDTARALASLGAFAVPACILVLTLVWEKRAGREVMGGGDIKLLFALALYMDWAGLLLTLLAGCLLGIVCGVLMGRTKGTAMPFGPFLAAGAVFAVCFGGPLLGWYFSLF